MPDAFALVVLRYGPCAGLRQPAGAGLAGRRAAVTSLSLAVHPFRVAARAGGSPLPLPRTADTIVRSMPEVA